MRTKKNLTEIFVEQYRYYESIVRLFGKKFIIEDSYIENQKTHTITFNVQPSAKILLRQMLELASIIRTYNIKIINSEPAYINMVHNEIYDSGPDIPTKIFCAEVSFR